MFRGYKAATVAGTGLVALVVSAVQPLIVPDPLQNVQQYMQLWIGVAGLNVICVSIELATRFVKSDSLLQRQQTLLAVEQFAPCLVAGTGLTWAMVRYSPEAAGLLPGLWAIVFSLGIFASCRQLPPQAVMVGVYYLVAGVTCLAVATDVHALSPWAMAGTFGVGQLLTAFVLYLGLERRHADC